MFVGEYRHCLDDKSRIVLPSKFRTQLSTTIYISLDFDQCLALFSEEEFQKRAEMYNSLSDFDSKARALKRVFFSNTCETTIDKQGRVMISKSLLDKVKISKDVVIVGSYDHIKIFSADVFASKEEEDESSFEALAAAFSSRKE